MRNKSIFNMYKFQKETGLVPYSLHYKITDDNFLEIINNVIKDNLGLDCYNFIFSSGTDNCLQILNTGDLIYKIYENPTKTQLMHSSYYILKYIFSHIFEEDIYFECTTSYRAQNKLYIDIIVYSNWIKQKDSIDNCNAENKNSYYAITEQLCVLEEKRINITKNKTTL